jgi:hypothetical protein
MAHGGAPGGRVKEKLRAASASSTMDAAKMLAVGKVRTEKAVSRQAREERKEKSTTLEFLCGLCAFARDNGWQGRMK